MEEKVNSSSAEIALKKGLNIPIISLAKENEEIYTIGLSEPLQISKEYCLTFASNFKGWIT